ncbi:MAG: response regulator transcription factor [Chloroflexi bacterium]|nr:response regulator transcription factor [Chloroflexota bacterium]
MSTVVLVDDQPDFLALGRALLGGDPRLRVVGEATSGPEAIDLVTRLRPEIVILDVQMPGLTGFETIPRLLKVDPTLRLILTSSCEHQEYKTLARALGARAFLSKKELSAAAVVSVLERE